MVIDPRCRIDRLAAGSHAERRTQDRRRPAVCSKRHAGLGQILAKPAELLADLWLAFAAGLRADAGGRLSWVS